METRNHLIIPASIISISLLISVIIFVSVWSANQKANQTITVTGSAKKEIVSDLGILRGSITVQAPAAEAAYRELERQKPLLSAYLNSKGFAKDSIQFFTINSFAQYEISESGHQTGRIRGYVYTQRLEIISRDVNKIKDISLEIPSLIEQGVNFDVEMPEYHYTRIAELKVDVQAAAAADAMTRAEKIAEATGREIGTMRTARMGVLQITPRLSNQISDYGVNDLSSIDKEITAVVNASFEIE
jgi:uncharacterized protein